MKCRLVFLLFIMLSCLQSKANLRPVFLSLHLSTEKQSYRQDEIIPFSIVFTNGAAGRRSILLPGSQQSGKKIVYLSFFSRDSKNHYTEVARESREVNLAGNKPGSLYFKYLEAGGSTSIVLFLNDTANYHKHIEAHHRIDKLPPGKYEVLAWYDPWDDSLSKYAFNKYGSFKDVGVVADRDTSRYDLPDNGTQSNYASITITDGPRQNTYFKSSAFCPLNCSFCYAIEQSDWTSVGKMIAEQTFHDEKSVNQKADSNWRQKHRNVFWLSDGPDAILSSLPTYTSRNFIFSNSKGYHYFYASWQLGIVYRGVSRLRSILWHTMRYDPHIPSSSIDYVKLVNFKQY